MTLAQIIFEEEKRRSFMPLSQLRHIIQTGGESIQQFASQTGERVRAVFRRGDEEGAPGDEGAAPALEEPADDRPTPGAIRELLERSQGALEDWQKRVDERVRAAVEALNPLGPLEKELRTLTQRLAELEKRLDNDDAQ
jgi:hypothetical protein